MITSAVLRGPQVAPVVLFTRWPTPTPARVIFEEATLDAGADAVWRAVRALGLAGDDPARVRAKERCRHLSIEWMMPAALEGVGGQRTLLTLTFEEVDARTHLTLTHAGFGRGPAWDSALALHRRWWPSVLATLAASLA